MTNQMEIQNVHMTSKINCIINLPLFAQKSFDIEYQNKCFVRCVIRLRRPKATVTVSHYGKIGVLGAKSISDAETAIRIVAQRIKKFVKQYPTEPYINEVNCNLNNAISLLKRGPNFERLDRKKKATIIDMRRRLTSIIKDFNNDFNSNYKLSEKKIRNLQATVNLNRPINLKKVYNAFDVRSVKFQKDRFPNLQLTLDAHDVKKKVILSRSGKAVLTGVKSKEELRQLKINLIRELEKHAL